MTRLARTSLALVALTLGSVAAEARAQDTAGEPPSDASAGASDAATSAGVSDAATSAGEPT